MRLLYWYSTNILYTVLDEVLASIFQAAKWIKNVQMKKPMGGEREKKNYKCQHFDQKFE